MLMDELPREEKTQAFLRVRRLYISHLVTIKQTEM